MSDDDRLKRLTELARQVWPHEEVSIHVDGDAGTASVLDVRLPPADPSLDALAHITPQRSSDGTRTLDALEAALLVLAGDAPPLLRVHPDCAVERADVPADAPAWVEKLAEEWEAKAAERASAGVDWPADRMLSACARDLRERAKEGR